MSWLPILLVALAAFAVAAFALRMPRAAWPMLGSALLFGLASYALQGHPGQAGSPRTAEPLVDETNSAMIEARRELFGAGLPPSNMVIVADGFARRGQYSDAVSLLREVVADSPRDAEAWVALGNALVEHAEGNPTPAAIYAYARAEAVASGNPAPAYFLGITLMRAGRPQDTRAIWAELVDGAPEDAEWLPAMRERLERLDGLLAGMAQE